MMLPIVIAKDYGRERREERRLNAAAVAIYDDTIQVSKHRSRFAPLFELIPSLGTVAILWVGGFRVIDGALTPGELRFDGVPSSVVVEELGRRGFVVSERNGWIRVSPHATTPLRVIEAFGEALADQVRKA